MKTILNNKQNVLQLVILVTFITLIVTMLISENVSKI
jgi:hypothetical protein